MANHKNNKNIDAQITQGDIIGTNKISKVTIQENGITIQKQSKTTPLHSIFKSSYGRSRERKKMLRYKIQNLTARMKIVSFFVSVLTFFFEKKRKNLS